MAARPDLKSLASDTRGATVVAYALVAGALSIGAFSAVDAFGAEIQDMMLAAADAIGAFLDGGV